MQAAMMGIVWQQTAGAGSCEIIQGAERANLKWGKVISSPNLFPVTDFPQ